MFRGSETKGVRPFFIVRPYATNLASYLWRCVRSGRYIPSITKKFFVNLYHSTILGFWWVVIRALLPTLGMIAILQHVPSLRPASLPYGLFVISGMVPWTGFINGLSRGTRALKQGRAIHSRLALPKLIFVISSGGVAAFFSAVFAVLLLIIVLYYYLSEGVNYIAFDWRLLAAPLAIVLSFLFAFGLASFTSVIFLFARDARLVLAVTTQFWFYFTPIIYGLEVLPESWRLAILYLNPMASIVELFRWSLFGVGDWTALSLTFSISISLAAFALGAWFLMRSEWVIQEVM